MPPPVNPDASAPAPPPLSTNVIDRINFAIQFEKYRDIILKRWWLIAVCVVGSLLYGAYNAYRQPDIYKAVGSMIAELPSAQTAWQGEKYVMEKVGYKITGKIPEALKYGGGYVDALIMTKRIA